MADRPYTLLSCGISLDGYLDSPATIRLRLSNEADLDRVDAVRASSDAILVGAATIRNDNPRLLVRSPERRHDRVARGLPPSPAKVTVTASGRLDVGGDFFTAGDADKIVYCPRRVADTVRASLDNHATVIDLATPLSMRELSEDLCARGVNRLMVEGGGTLHTQFLTDDLADELQLVIAPLFVGDSRARRFALDGCYPWNSERRAELADVQRIGDVVLLRYALSSRYGTERQDP
ncbi:MAG TPA: dihydrofolate reductase family protein [Micromonosporaceae bacterium]|nr:dihydrofolate reductase family protein [Micromonosporaceae bacterium]